MPNIACPCTREFATRDASVGYGQSFVSQAEADDRAKADSRVQAGRQGAQRAANFPCPSPCRQSHEVVPGNPTIVARAPQDAQGFHATALVKWSLYITCTPPGVTAKGGRGKRRRGRAGV